MVRLFDLGMGEGTITDLFIKMFKELKLDYEIHGFEPCKETFNAVKEKYKNDFTVHIYNFALSDDNKRCKLYKAPNPMGNSLCKSKYNVDETKYEEVEALLFSDWFYKNVNIQPNDFTIVKINIEGSEFEVYRDVIVNGMQNHVHVFCGSLGDIYKLGKTDAEIDEFLKMLVDASIKCIELSPGKTENLEKIKREIRTNVTRASSIRTDAPPTVSVTAPPIKYVPPVYEVDSNPAVEISSASFVPQEIEKPKRHMRRKREKKNG